MAKTVQMNFPINPKVRESLKRIAKMRKVELRELVIDALAEAMGAKANIKIEEIGKAGDNKSGVNLNVPISPELRMKLRLFALKNHVALHSLLGKILADRATGD
jgi:predicted HicB family RNase H-like nuclease